MSSQNPKPETRYVTEVPSSLKQLARLVVRGFYSIEDALIIDMLVRNPCMKEDDISELLRFDKKQMRARITTLKNDKFIQIRLKMETGPDGKAQKINYYFINYKTFVNVVKYKLDLMRKRMETEERDATSRASFRCARCSKTFTDLEADQLFDFQTQEFHCTFCGSNIEEDMSALPKKDSRLLLAKFNEQLQPLYDLLREVEGIQLAPEILEPEPVDLDTIRGITKPNHMRQDGQMWSGEATRNQGFAVEETTVDINIGDNDTVDHTRQVKERPVWLTESTVVSNDDSESYMKSALDEAASTATTTTSNRSKKESEDIMAILLQHEKKSSKSDPTQSIRRNNVHSDDSSDDENGKKEDKGDFVEVPSESEDDDVPCVFVAGQSCPIDQINDKLIAQMTQHEKGNYIQIYQDFYSHIYD